LDIGRFFTFFFLILYLPFSRIYLLRKRGHGYSVLEIGKMKRALLLLTALLVCASGIGWADTFGTGANQFEIEFVTISGDTNPATGIPAGNSFTFTGVASNYRIGKFEITNDQWSKFKTAYGTVNGSPFWAYDDNPYWTGMNVPTNNVSWYEAAQFVNWLNTSNGHQAAYKFTGTRGTGDYTFVPWEVTDAGYNPSNPYRNSNSFYFLPTEDEWVKAAYWNGVSLHTYATKDGSTPAEWISNGGTNSDGQAAGWNYGYAYPNNSDTTDQPWDVTAGYSPEELNGTYDMMGNVWEFLESPYKSGNYSSRSTYGIRGGSYYDGNSYLASTYRLSGDPVDEYLSTGFRVASVPEPCTVLLLGLGGVMLREKEKGKR
jgi:formylglycine-generating enzyme required for sulfatase activity